MRALGVLEKDLKATANGETTSIFTSVFLVYRDIVLTDLCWITV